MQVFIAILVGLMVLVGFTMAGITVYWLIRYVLKGRLEGRFDQLGRRFWYFFKYALGQARVIREPAGLLHIFIFWGFLVLQIETLEYIVRAFAPHFHLQSIFGTAGQNGLMFLQES